jgi:hypothetical protein
MKFMLVFEFHKYVDHSNDQYSKISNIIVMVIIFIIIILIAFLLCINIQENYGAVSLDDIKTDIQTLNKIRRMLYDINRIFQEYHIKYWMDGRTLLGAVQHRDILPWDDHADICILKEDENILLNVEPQLNNLGYGLSLFWSGYKIYPLNGSEVKFYNPNWVSGNQDDDIKNNKDYHYKYPFVDVYFIDFIDGTYQFSNKKVREMWSKHYYNAKDLFPLKKYKFDCFELSGPQNPIPYLSRVYGSNHDIKKLKS